MRSRENNIEPHLFSVLCNERTEKLLRGTRTREMVSARLASPARRRATSPHERHAPHTPPSPRPPACQMPRRSRPIIASCMCTAAICTLCKTPHTTPAPPRPALPRRAQSTPQHPNDPTPRRAHLAAAPTPMYITPQLPPPPSPSFHEHRDAHPPAQPRAHSQPGPAPHPCPRAAPSTPRMTAQNHTPTSQTNHTHTTAIYPSLATRDGTGLIRIPLVGFECHSKRNSKQFETTETTRYNSNHRDSNAKHSKQLVVTLGHL